MTTQCLGATLKTVSVTEFSTHPAEVLAAVTHGQRLVLTRRGIPVADIIPHARRSGRSSSAEMAEARRQLDMLRQYDKREDWSDFLEW